MTIYLDANVLFNWLDLAALDRVALSVVAAESSQRIVVPQTAMEEAESHYQRRLAAAAAKLEEGQKAFNELFHSPALTEVPPGTNDLIQDWRTSLLDLTHVVGPPDGAAEEAIRREIFRKPPAQAIRDPGGQDIGATGARDALIWLTVVQHHRDSDDDGHFISADRDFTVRSGGFKPDLLSDLEGIERPLHAYPSVFEFLRRTGELVVSKGFELDLPGLQERAEGLVRRILPLTLALPHAAFGSVENRYRYDAFVHDAVAVRLRSGRRYDTPTGYLIVVDSVWRIRADCYRFEADALPDASTEAVEDAWYEGGLQMYLPTEGHAERLAQLVSGRLRLSEAPK